MTQPYLGTDSGKALWEALWGFQRAEDVVPALEVPEV